MPYSLIPFPISIIVVFAFGAAILAILWNMRKRGKLFLFLFYLSLIIAIIMFALFSYSLVSSILNGPRHSSYPRPTIVPQPSVPQILLESLTLF